MEDKNQIQDMVKTYLDRIEQAKLTSKLNIPEINELELKLTRLRQNKNKEIKEYINRFSTQPDFYVRYGAMVKKIWNKSIKNKKKN